MSHRALRVGDPPNQREEYQNHCNTLSFVSLNFGSLPRKTSRLPKIFGPCRTHKIIGKDSENIKISKEIPSFNFIKEIQKNQGKERQGMNYFATGSSHQHCGCFVRDARATGSCANFRDGLGQHLGGHVGKFCMGSVQTGSE